MLTKHFRCVPRAVDWDQAPAFARFQIQTRRSCDPSLRPRIADLNLMSSWTALMTGTEVPRKNGWLWLDTQNRIGENSQLHYFKITKTGKRIGEDHRMDSSQELYKRMASPESGTERMTVLFARLNSCLQRNLHRLLKIALIHDLLSILSKGFTVESVEWIALDANPLQLKRKTPNPFQIVNYELENSACSWFIFFNSLIFRRARFSIWFSRDLRLFPARESDQLRYSHRFYHLLLNS